MLRCSGWLSAHPQVMDQVIQCKFVNFFSALFFIHKVKIISHIHLEKLQHISPKQATQYEIISKLQSSEINCNFPANAHFISSKFQGCHWATATDALGDATAFSRLQSTLLGELGACLAEFDMQTLREMMSFFQLNLLSLVSN